MFMNKVILVITICLISLSAYALKENDSLLLQKIDQLQATVNNVAQQQVKDNKDSLSISVEHFDKLTQAFDKKDNILDTIIPSLIAIFVVIISTGGAIYLGIKQIRVQTTNAEEQIRSQEAQAQDNLRVAREQIQETSKMTLAQVRANNVSQARINWIQDLRNDLSQYSGEVAIINFYLQEVIILNEKGKKEEAKKLYNEQIEKIKNARQYAFKIKLFLNQKEPDHLELEKLIDRYYEVALENYETVSSDYSQITDEILKISKKILKDAWEQAKNEGTL